MVIHVFSPFFLSFLPVMFVYELEIYLISKSY